MKKGPLIIFFVFLILLVYFFKFKKNSPEKSPDLFKEESIGLKPSPSQPSENIPPQEQTPSPIVPALPKPAPDLNLEVDAGSTEESALPLELKRYDVNHLGASDTQDVFSFEAKRGQSFVVEIMPKDNFEGTAFFVRVTHQKKKLLEQSFDARDSFQTKRFEILSTGTHYLEIEIENDLPETKVYTLELKEVPTSNTFRPILKF